MISKGLKLAIFNTSLHLFNEITHSTREKHTQCHYGYVIMDMPIWILSICRIPHCQVGYIFSHTQSSTRIVEFGNVTYRTSLTFPSIYRVG